MAGSRRSIRTGAGAAMLVIALAACSSAPGGSQRPTDPHELTTAAIRATAALSTARLHVELTSSSQMQDPNNAQPQQMRTTMTLDADVDVANRLLAGRESMTMNAPAGFGAPMGPQNVDLIVTATDSFIRMNGQAKWMKTGGALSGGPTNSAIATALVGVLDNPDVTYERLDAIECSLGTCDHVVIHVPGRVLVGALALLSGQPMGADVGAAMPDIDVDARIDQASVLISELRFEVVTGPSRSSVLLSLSNAGQPIQIVAPAPGLVDDNTGGFGGVVGPEPSFEEATLEPVFPDDSPPAP
jgi:hypothetical protein